MLGVLEMEFNSEDSPCTKQGKSHYCISVKNLPLIFIEHHDLVEWLLKVIYDMTTLLNELFHLFVWPGSVVLQPWQHSVSEIWDEAAPCDVEMARADHCPDHTWPPGTQGPRGGEPGPYIRCHVAPEEPLAPFWFTSSKCSPKNLRKVCWRSIKLGRYFC